MFDGGDCSGAEFRNLYSLPESVSTRIHPLIWFTAQDHGWPTSMIAENFDIPPARVEGSDIRASFVGHSTWFLQFSGVNVLTDPVWSDRVGPLRWLGPKRVAAPGIKFEDLPTVDVILISHNHYDHLDIATLKMLWRRDKPIILVPSGDEVLIKQELGDRAEVVPLTWGQCFDFNQDVRFVFEPAHHWSSRWIFDRDKTLWGAFVIHSRPGDIFFAGDTAYSPHFLDIGAKYKDGFRLSLLPIGDYDPFISSHMNPEQAVTAHLELKSQFSIGMHFSTFRLSATKFLEPVERLEAARKDHDVAADRFVTIQEGSYMFVP